MHLKPSETGVHYKPDADPLESPISLKKQERRTASVRLSSLWRCVNNVNRIVYLPYNGFYDYFRIIKPQFL